MVFEHFGLGQGIPKGNCLVWNKVSVSQKLAQRSIDSLVYVSQTKQNAYEY